MEEEVSQTENRFFSQSFSCSGEWVWGSEDENSNLGTGIYWHYDGKLLKKKELDQ